MIAAPRRRTLPTRPGRLRACVRGLVDDALTVLLEACGADALELAVARLVLRVVLAARQTPADG